MLIVASQIDVLPQYMVSVRCNDDHQVSTIDPKAVSESRPSTLVALILKAYIVRVCS